MHTGDWWWRTQKTLPVRSSLVPVLFKSDQTCLTNFSGDKKLWPLFMSIGNILSEICNKPSSQAWILIGLFPVSPKRNNKAGGLNMLCGDSKVRKCIPILSTWLADHMENVNIHYVKTNRYSVCIASPQQLGVLSKTPLGQHNHAAYKRLFLAGDIERCVSHVNECG
ncbi:hypothetical protein BGX38DRAFT_1106329 [Terfezia claveryi]|nr:hypothetical protein BGX38DRAFT_1106329 [Terfezia claveryi]